MIMGWILENGPHLKKIVVKRSTILGGGVDISHEGDETSGVSIEAEELSTLIDLLTECRDNPASQIA